MKNFNFWGFMKNLTFKGMFTKNQYRVRISYKDVLGQFVNLRAWQERGIEGRGMFLRGWVADNPIKTMLYV